jgi:GntR family transcriptional regulator/MocR family aminotransferase
LRLGFVVVPPPLTAAFVRARTLMDRGMDVVSQAVLAEFMREGVLGAHIRRMRTEYAARRDALLEALARHCQLVTPLAAPGGLHLTLLLPGGIEEAAVVRAARARGLAVSPLAAYYLGAPRQSGLVAGFASTPMPLAAEVARGLAAAIRAA